MLLRYINIGPLGSPKPHILHFHRETTKEYFFKWKSSILLKASESYRFAKVSRCFCCHNELLNKCAVSKSEKWFSNPAQTLRTSVKEYAELRAFAPFMLMCHMIRFLTSHMTRFIAHWEFQLGYTLFYKGLEGLGKRPEQPTEFNVGFRKGYAP